MRRRTVSKEAVFFYDYKHFDFAQCDTFSTKCIIRIVRLSGVEAFVK